MYFQYCLFQENLTNTKAYKTVDDNFKLLGCKDDQDENRTSMFLAKINAHITSHLNQQVNSSIYFGKTSPKHDPKHVSLNKTTYEKGK